jgi:hypothetical protein
MYKALLDAKILINSNYDLQLRMLRVKEVR